jgi:hypothetical protein
VKVPLLAFFLSMVCVTSPAYGIVTEDVHPASPHVPIYAPPKEPTVVYTPPVKRVRITRGVERWRSLVAKYFPADAVDEALLCISLESGGNPDAVSSSGTYVGLFQMDGGWGSFEERTDPVWAVRNAANSYKAKGWAAWPPMKARGY